MSVLRKVPCEGMVWVGSAGSGSAEAGSAEAGDWEAGSVGETSAGRRRRVGLCVCPRHHSSERPFLSTWKVLKT